MFGAMLLAALWLERFVRPRAVGTRRWQGVLLHSLIMTMLFGFFLAISGNMPVAVLLALSVLGLLSVASNAKYAMLGEPLLFSDLALIVAIFRYPRFYLTALSTGQRWILAIGALLLVGALVLLFVPSLLPHSLGLALLVPCTLVLRLLLKSALFEGLMPVPDAAGDVARYGLIATLLLYWHRWRYTDNPPACPATDWEGRRSGGQPDLLVVVQCESFADPVDLTQDPGQRLDGLARARSLACQWGDLHVSGFGAYTMRTEYGVLFGRSEEALGFRRYDPFLTAGGETSYALSSRMARCGYSCLFVHPHDMRFYGRDRLMPAIGFDRLIGQENFPPLHPSGHHYVDDRVLGTSIGEMIASAKGPTFIYAVTMENHGPWGKDRMTGSLGGLGAYLAHLRSSDDMLLGLIEQLSGTGRTSLLVFFGDHRPSIPGVLEPGGDRHTPYVMLRFSADGRIVSGANRRVDLSPDQLHHAILRCVQIEEADPASPRDDAPTLNFSQV